LKLSQIKKNYEKVDELVDLIDDRRLSKLSAFLNDRISNPDSYVVMFGETSSGKSTLLNGLMGEELLYTSVKPSTGAVIEICFDNESEEPKYFAINKNATMEKLNKATYLELSKKPDDKLSRLRIQIEKKLQVEGALRVIDTPGYGSLVDNHEKVLLDILPESNLIIYVVSYKVGIQQDDINFLNFAKEVISEGTEFVLVVNRVPEDIEHNGRRIVEIKEYVSDSLHIKPELFLVPTVRYEKEKYPLPVCSELWSYVGNSINSAHNQRILAESFRGYVDGLLEECENVILNKRIQVEASEFDKEKFRLFVKELEETRIEIKEKIVIPTFNDMIAAIPPRLNQSKKRVESKIESKINAAHKLAADEMMGYITSHMLHFETSNEINDLKVYIEATLRELDKKVDDKLNVAIIRIEKTIELNFNAALENLTKGALKRGGGKALNQSLLQYFKKFAGNGGTGIANASKHLLKKFGNLFGKTFSRETHNKLAQTLSKIGANSAKAVSAGVAVIIEAAFMIVDVLTWQEKLKKAVKKSVEKWHDEVVDLMVEDLDKLKLENIRLIDDEIDMLISKFDFSENSCNDSREYVEMLTNRLEEIKTEINYIGGENE